MCSMDNSWKFDGSMRTPLREEIKSSIAQVGYQTYYLDKEQIAVFLDENPWE